MKTSIPLSEWAVSDLPDRTQVPDAPWVDYGAQRTPVAMGTHQSGAATTVYRQTSAALHYYQLPKGAWQSMQLRDRKSAVIIGFATIATSILSAVGAIGAVLHLDPLIRLAIFLAAFLPIFFYLARLWRSDQSGSVAVSVLPCDPRFNTTEIKTMIWRISQSLGLQWRDDVTGEFDWRGRLGPKIRVEYRYAPTYHAAMFVIQTSGAANAQLHRRLKGLILSSLGMAGIREAQAAIPSPSSQPANLPGPAPWPSPPVPPPQQPEPPPCPTCGQPLQWISEYSQWFCSAEQLLLPSPSAPSGP